MYRGLSPEAFPGKLTQNDCGYQVQLSLLVLTARLVACGWVTTWGSAERVGLGFTLPSKKAVVGPNGPKRQMFSWQQVLDSREIGGAPGGTPIPDLLVTTPDGPGEV